MKKLPGMLSKTVMIPDLELGLVILTNTSDDGASVFEAVSNTIIDAYLDLDDFGWIEKLSGYFKSRKLGVDSVI